MTWKTSAAFALLTGLSGMAGMAGPALGASCKSVTHLGAVHTVCEADLRETTARLYWKDAAGELYGDFEALPAEVAIATNGGMYHEDRRPVGHYLEEGVEVQAPIASDGPGNFGLLPNGVLCLSSGKAEIFETRAYIAETPACTYATQSGPMLVIDGALHPRFLSDGTSRKRRGGVGVSADGQTLFIAVSTSLVNFYDFATLFRDVLETPNALFTDGTVTRLYDRASGRRDLGRQMGPILAITD